MDGDGVGARSPEDLRACLEWLESELELLRDAVRWLGRDIHGEDLPWPVERAVDLPRPRVPLWRAGDGGWPGARE